MTAASTTATTDSTHSTPAPKPAPRLAPQPRVTTKGVRLAGIGLAVGSLVWASTLALFGPQSESAFGTMMGDLGGLLFQLGLFGLLAVQERTFATGPKRFWKVAFVVERVLLALAAAWSLLHAFRPSLAILPILDLFWPLSMVGMFVIGMAILVKGRWTGALRIWPAIAESWAVVCVPALAIFGPAVGSWLPATHLLVGYVTLGILLALLPERTGAARVG